MVNTAVRSRVTVSDEEVKTYYKQNERLIGGRSTVAPAADPGRAFADRCERRRRGGARSAVAAKVVELARGGTSFAELAKTVLATTTAPRTTGGDLGWVGKGVLADALDEAMAAMEPNDVRGPIRTERGWRRVAAGRAQGGRPEAVRRESRSSSASSSTISRSRRRSSRGCASCARRRTSTFGSNRAASRASGRRADADECGTRSALRPCRR